MVFKWSYGNIVNKSDGAGNSGELFRNKLISREKKKPVTLLNSGQ